MNNRVVTIVGAVLILVVLIQSYFIYDLKQNINAKEVMPSKIEKPFSSLSQFGKDDFDPFKEMYKMHQAFEQAFGNFNAHFNNHPFFKESLKGMASVPLADFSDNPKNYEIKLNIPGSDNHSIEVKTDNEVLEILAYVERDNNNSQNNYFKRERYTHQFKRTFRLPKDADRDKIEKEYKNGVLTITIPKK
jgi:HSP20 family molecular chaperone IbpA